MNGDDEFKVIREGMCTGQCQHRSHLHPGGHIAD